MTNYVYDDTDLAFPKNNLNSLPSGANEDQYVVDEDWNGLCQAVEDLKDHARGAKWYGLEEQVTDPIPAGITNYLWLSNAGILTVKRGVSTIQLVANARQILAGTGLDGGGDLAADRTLSLEPVSPSPAGIYSKANIEVDAYGRVISASSGGGSGYDAIFNNTTLLTARTSLRVDGTNLVATDDVGNAWTAIALGTNIEIVSLAFGAGSGASVSASDKGKLAYDEGTDKLRLSVNGGSYSDVLTALTGVEQTRQVIAGAGLTGGGALSGDVTLNAIAHADGSIVVNANDIQVGILASDAQHGNRGGGALHANAVASGAAGFLSGADKALIDAIPATYVAQTRTLTASDGLTGGGDLSANRAFSVGQGAGITVNSDDVAVNQAYAFAWLASHSWKAHAAFSGSQLSLTTAAIQTTDDTQTSLFTLTLSDTTAYLLIADVVGRDAAGVERAAYSKAVLVYREGGGATIQGTVQDNFPDIETSGGLGATWTVSGNDVRLSVTGLVATNINWAATVRRQAVSGNA